MKLVEKVFGTHSSRELKRIYPTVDKIEALRPAMQSKSDEELRNQTRQFKERLAAGGALFTAMSGSGASVFALYNDVKMAECAAEDFTGCDIFVGSLSSSGVAER